MKLIEYQGRCHLCLFARRNIGINEEIRYDYGTDDLPWRQSCSKDAKKEVPLGRPEGKPKADGNNKTNEPESQELNFIRKKNKNPTSKERNYKVNKPTLPEAEDLSPDELLEGDSLSQERPTDTNHNRPAI